MMASWKLAAPLAAGCSVVLKPSELTPLSTLRCAEIINDVLPKGVVNVIHGRGAGIGNRLINSPQMEAISVTGSPATGAAAMRAGAEQLRHVHLELGGKAPVIVFDDADIDAVVETIRGGSYFNAGQDCAQPCRIMVADRIFDRLVADTAAAVSTIKTGAQRDADVGSEPVQGLPAHRFERFSLRLADVVGAGLPDVCFRLRPHLRARRCEKHERNQRADEPLPGPAVGEQADKASEKPSHVTGPGIQENVYHGVPHRERTGC